MSLFEPPSILTSARVESLFETESLSELLEGTAQLILDKYHFSWVQLFGRFSNKEALHEPLSSFRSCFLSRSGEPIWGLQKHIYHFDKYVEIEELDLLVSTFRNGPFTLFNQSITSDEAVLFLNPSPTKHLTIVLYLCGQSRLTGPHISMQLGAELDLIFKVASNNLFFSAYRRDLQRRTTFYESLLKSTANNLTDAFAIICKAWALALDADWVWLWLYNPDETANEWELAHSFATISDFSLPKERCTLSTKSVMEHASKFNKPIFVSNLGGASQFEKPAYNVEKPETLQALGCEHFYCIPLMIPDETKTSQHSDGSFSLLLRAGICAHFKTIKEDSPVHPAATLSLMGNLSAVRLLDSYEARKRELLTRLNLLEEQYLTQTSLSPATLRTIYSEQLVLLIKHELQVNYASIFVMTENGEKLSCIASTNIFSPNGQVVPKTQYSKVFYAKGEGWTGAVAREAKLRVLTINNNSDRVPFHICKWTETPPAVSPHSVALAFHPITTRRSQGRQEGKCIGVIRCAEPYQKITTTATYSKNFDTFQLLLLDFISKQIAPVLDALDAQIHRERDTSKIKHDLMVPIGNLLNRTVDLLDLMDKTNFHKNSCMQTVRKMEQAIRIRPGLVEASQTNAVPSADLQTLKSFCEGVILSAPANEIERYAYIMEDLPIDARNALKLVTLFDSENDYLASFAPIPTYLEGHIVARLKSALSPHAKQKKNMTIYFDTFQGIVPKLMIDPVLIERVFTNVIENAIKYGNPDSKIMIFPSATREGYTITISNFGIPIFPGEQDAIFEGDYRSEVARRTASGQGHGLKIAREIMSKHKGAISASHDEVQGRTDITLFFPRSLVSN